MTMQKTKTVCLMTADIPGNGDGYFFGETITVNLDGGYTVECREDEMHLIGAFKAFVMELYGEEVYVNLFDENGNEILVR